MADARVDIGFDGGQVLALKLSEDELKQLRGALEAGNGWHDLKAVEGQVAVDLAKVAYVHVDADTHRVGFSSDAQ